MAAHVNQPPSFWELKRAGSRSEKSWVCVAQVMPNNASAEVYLLPPLGLLHVALSLKILHTGKADWLIVNMSLEGGSPTSEAGRLPRRGS